MATYQYKDWLFVQVLAALSEEFDRSMGYDAAIDYLKEKGVEYFNRETDPSKGYGNSITVDVTTAVDAANFKELVFGTLAEGNMMISRINDFDKLYFEPTGTAVLFIYKDRPGLLGKLVSLWQKRALIFTIYEILMILVVIIP